MTLTDIVVLIAAGASIYIGCTGNTFYYGKWGWIPPRARLKSAPTRLGRALFLSVGILFLLAELKRLLLENR